MTTSTVELIVNAAKALNPLRAVSAASKKTQQAVDKLKQAVQRTAPAFQRMRAQAESALQKIKAKAKEAAASFKGFNKAVALAAGSAAALAGLRFAFMQAGELERQTKSLQVLTGSLKTAKGIISDLQAFGAVTPFTSQELIETAKRMKAFGFETGKVVGITKRLADVAGATGADLGGIATAFGQIQAKGRLQGEELLQLQERGVALQDELRKMYGLTGEEFSKALQKGQIGAESVEAALIRLTEKGGKYANGAIAQSDTLFGKLSTLQDAIGRLGQNLGKALSPVFKFLITQVTRIANAINNLFARIEARRAAIQELRDSGLKGSALRKAIRSIDVSDVVAEQAAPADLPSPKIPQLRQGNGSTKTAADITKAAADKVRSLEQQTLLASALNEEERKQFERQIEIANLLENKNGLSETQLENQVEALTNLYEQEDATRTIIDANEKRAEKEKQTNDAAKAALKDQQREAQRLEQLFGGIGQTISDGIVNGLTGAQSAAEALGNTLRNVGNQLLRLGVNTGLKALFPGSSVFSGLSGFANGGRPPVGRPSIVGERGPELFVPSRAGTIVPNHMMGGANIVVNVDASGSQAQGNEPNAKALGAVIGAAVQAELVKQKRPGGLLN